MKFLNDSLPWATIMTALLVGIAAIAGAVVVILNPDTLNFQQYLDVLKNFALAVGIVGIGRGIASYGKQTATAALLKDESLVAPAPPGGAVDGAGAVAAYGAMTYARGNATDPYADLAWPEAAPPPQPPAAAGAGLPPEM